MFSISQSRTSLALKLTGTKVRIWDDKTVVQIQNNE